MSSSQQSPPTIIWFQLMDSVTGEPFTGTSATFVLRDSLAVPIVAAFQDAVKAKYSDSHLKGIAPSDLKVYKNKAAFDKRNSEEDQQEPLDEDMSIDGLGMVMKLAVIVVVPSTTEVFDIALDFSIDGSEAVLRRYESIGDSLASDPIIKEMVTVLDNIKPKGPTVPFLFVEDSSGAGKTQAAFALRSALALKNQFVYLTCNPNDTRTQRIYCPFVPISSAFIAAVEADVQKLKLEPFAELDVMVFSASNLERHSLNVFGFFYQIMTSQSLPERVRLEPKTFKEVWDKIKSVGKKVPVVVLDEFPDVHDGNRILVRFMRNCIRALRFRLIMMGTNASASNIVDLSSNSRGDDDISTWCYIFTRVPSYNMNCSQLPENTSAWVRNVISHSRPLFAEIAASKVIDLAVTDTVGSIDNWLSSIANEIVRRKTLFGSDFGKHGQVCLFLNASYFHESGIEIHRTPLIHHHFAHLKETKYVRAKLESNGRETKVSWKPVSVFPNPDEDLLLFLCLMGTPRFAPFQIYRVNNFFTSSFRSFLTDLRNAVGSRKLQLCFDSLMQASSDRKLFEAALAGSICVASRGNGVAGSSLSEVVARIYSHIVQDDSGRSDLKNYRLIGLAAKSDIAIFMKKFVVPYLAPPNISWPSWIRDLPGSKFGHISRPGNAEMVDITSDFGLSGESKDYAGSITSDVMSAIIKRVPDESEVHLVFSNKLQGEYFTNKRKNDKKSGVEKKFEVDKMAFCVVEKSDKSDRLVLADIDGLPGVQQYCEGWRLVIIFLIGRLEDVNSTLAIERDVQAAELPSKRKRRKLITE